MPLNSGTRVGAYEIVELPGAGGMGEVYRAKDTKLGLFYRRVSKLMAVRIEERGGSLDVSAPTLVFDDPYRLDTSFAKAVANYDIAPDGKRFVMVEEPQAMAATQIARIEVILNRLDELKRRVPSR